MARIRSVKPEFWSDQRLATRSRDARLLYIALWNFADERARMVGDPRQVKGLCLPMDDDLGPKEIDVLLDELAEIGRVVRYTVDGEMFLFLPHLSKHQRLDSAQDSRFPEPPDYDPAPTPQKSGPTPDKSGEVSGQSGEVTGESAQVQPRAHVYVAGSREHVAGSRSKPLSLVPSDAPAEPDPIRVVFDAWRSTLPNGSRPKLTDARRDAVKAALERYPLEDVVDAARGWLNDTWEDRPQQNDLAQLVHMGSKRKPANILERMRDLHRRGPPRVMGKRTAEIARNQTGLHALVENLQGGDGGAAGAVGGAGSAPQRELSRPAD
jgi:hypothetical protein